MRCAPMWNGKSLRPSCLTCERIDSADHGAVVLPIRSEKIPAGVNEQLVERVMREQVAVLVDEPGGYSRIAAPLLVRDLARRGWRTMRCKG